MLTKKLPRVLGLLYEDWQHKVRAFRKIASTPIAMLETRHQNLNISYFLDGTAAKDEILTSMAAQRLFSRGWNLEIIAKASAITFSNNSLLPKYIAFTLSGTCYVPKFTAYLFSVCVGTLLFGHQAVNPYRVNTACAPMTAYTWTPSVIPRPESRPAHAASLNGQYCTELRRARHCFCSLGPHPGRMGCDECPSPGVSPL